MSLLSDLLSKVNVGKVIHVDDEYNWSVDQLCQDHAMLLADEFGIDTEGLEYDEIEEACRVQAATMTPEFMDALRQKIEPHEDVEKIQDRKAATWLRRSVQSGSLETLGSGATPFELQNNISALLDKCSDCLALLVMDQDLGLGMPGVHVANEFRQHPRVAGILILTHSTNTLEDELGEEDAVGGLIFLSKSRVISAADNDEESGMIWASKIRRALVSMTLKSMQTEVKKVFDDAHTRALSAIGSLTLDELDWLIAGSAYAEGNWIADQLARVFTGIQRAELLGAMRASQIVHKAATRMVPLCSPPHNQRNIDFASLRARAVELQRREVYLADVSDIGLELALGDVFTDEKHFWVLVEQPCDLAVRANGRRVDGGDDERFGFLAQVASGTAREYNQYTVYLPYFDKDKPSDQWYVNFHRSMYVPLWLLDLCVFSDDGHCSIDVSVPRERNTIPSWTERFNCITDYCNKLLRAPEECRKRVSRVPSRCKLKGEGTCINFHMRRQMRVLSPYAEEILGAKGLFLTRWARERDFGRDPSTR